MPAIGSPLSHPLSLERVARTLRKRLSSILPLVLFMSCSACGGSADLGEVLPTYRYRLTVEINTPEGVKIGSGVIQVETSVAGKYNLGGAYLAHRKVTGDAVVVDLGRRGRVFVVLKDHFSQVWPAEVMLHLIKPVGGVSVKDYRRIEITRVLALRGPIALHAHLEDPRFPLDDGLPDFVVFSNPADLGTARIVQPDELSSYFGSGVSLRSISVQITNDTVSRSAVHSLPWLSNDEAYVRNSKRQPDGTSVGALNGIDFSRGM